MRKALNPANGRKWNQAHPSPPSDHLISVAESHEEHLVVNYPKIAPEVEALKAADVPASFRVAPGHISGMALARLGVAGICRRCGETATDPNGFACEKHPENGSGGGNFLRAA